MVCLNRVHDSSLLRFFNISRKHVITYIPSVLFFCYGNCNNNTINTHSFVTLMSRLRMDCRHFCSAGTNVKARGASDPREGGVKKKFRPRVSRAPRSHAHSLLVLRARSLKIGNFKRVNTRRVMNELQQTGTNMKIFSPSFLSFFLPSFHGL